eukprot:6035142-Ditylum_brightwellii.AAC.1
MSEQVQHLDGSDSEGTKPDWLLNYFGAMNDCCYAILYNEPDYFVGDNTSSSFFNDLNCSSVESEITLPNANYSSEEL